MIKNNASAGIMLDLSLKYVEMGFALVPLRYGAKTPCTGNGWNKQDNLVTTPEGCRSWWDEGQYGIGAQLGASGLMSFDIDDIENTRILFEECGLDLDDLLETHPATVKGRGYRLFFQGNVLKRRALIHEGRTIFEIRGGNGCQDVLPGSLHPDGFFYTWHTEPKSRDDIPEAPEWLLTMYDAIEPKAKTTAPGVPERTSVTSDSDKLYVQARERIDLRERLRQHGYRDCGDRMLSPNSSSQEPGVTFSEGGEKFFSFHASDDLTHGDVVDVIAHLEHGGDYRAAYRAISMELGLAQAQKGALSTWGEANVPEVIGKAYLALEKMQAPTKVKKTMLQLFEILVNRAHEGHLAWVDGSYCVMTNGTTGLAALGARGCASDIGFRLRALGEIGLLEPVTRGEGSHAAYRIRIAPSPERIRAFNMTDEQLAAIQVPIWRQGRTLKKRPRKGDDDESTLPPSQDDSAMDNAPRPSPALALLSRLLTPLALAESGVKPMTKTEKAAAQLLGVSNYAQAREKFTEERDFDAAHRNRVLRLLEGSIYATVVRLNELLRFKRTGGDIERLKKRLALLKQRIERITDGERVSAVML